MWLQVTSGPALWVFLFSQRKNLDSNSVLTNGTDRLRPSGTGWCWEARARSGTKINYEPEEPQRQHRVRSELRGNWAFMKRGTRVQPVGTVRPPRASAGDSWMVKRERYSHLCCCLVSQSCPTLVTPWTVAHQAP